MKSEGFGGGGASNIREDPELLKIADWQDEDLETLIAQLEEQCGIVWLDELAYLGEEEREEDNV